MKSVFVGHFRPTESELSELWQNCVFIIDANVLLNLYRYSSETRSELEKALSEIKDSVFITHQAAKEFLKNRLSVTAGQASEYTNAIKKINDLVENLSSKDRHPFLSMDELPNFEGYSKKLISNLESQQKGLLDKFTNDEILSFVEKMFNGKTGNPFSKDELDIIAKDGETRYQSEIPPGFKDSKKESSNDPYHKYGDLFVWKQVIEYAKKNTKPVIFITDDKKEDWWLEQSGRTISPRPELIEEFWNETKQKFWMYSVDRFIQESAKLSKSIISDDVIKEILKVSLESKALSDDSTPSITVSQETSERTNTYNAGLLVVTLNKAMRYATGTGKFSPRLLHVPEFDVELISSPDDQNNINLSFGCGTVKNFNIHLKAKFGTLPAGDYVLKYVAMDDESAE